MISYIEGKIAHKEPAYIIIDINGVGYEIKVSLTTYSEIKELSQCKLFTHLSIKEDAHTLFGFYHFSEKKTFLELIGISGVGPGTALTVLSSLSFAELQNAIIMEDVRIIQSIKGIGPKTAQRIILELKDKFKKDAVVSQSHNIHINSQTATRNDALSALLALGINRLAAEKSIDSILKAHEKNITTEELIKIALKSA